MARLAVLSLKPSASGIPFLLILHFPAQSLAYIHYTQYVLAQNKFLKLAKSEVGNKFHRNNVFFFFFPILLSLALLIVTISHG